MPTMTNASFICPSCGKRSRLRSIDDATCEHCGQGAGNGKPAKRNKYGAIKKQIDGITFDSTAESKRYLELRFLEKAGHVAALEIHPVFEFTLGPGVTRRYTADFRYRVATTGESIIEDVKGGNATVTRDYKLRKAAVEAQHNITIREVRM